MIVCNNKKISQKIRVARLHGLSKDAWKRYLPESVKNKKNLNIMMSLKLNEV